jgi:NitT/TauT family transport system substrate-binding protein
LVALHKGFYEREGLEVDYHFVGLAPQHNKEMAEGRWNMTLSSADTMFARTTTDGVDYVLFLQADEGLDVQLIGQPEFTTLEDLRGKLFAADPVDSNFDVIRNKIMSDHGIAEDEYRYEVIGSTPKRCEAFLDKRVAAAMLSPPWSEKAVAAGGHVLATGSDYVADWPHTCGWGLRNWVEENRSLVVRFIRAWADASDWLQSPGNREETLRLLATQNDLNRARAENACAFVVPRGRINPEALRRNLELRIELGYYKPPHKATEDFYDISYWCEATGQPAPPAAGMPENGTAR